MTSINAPRRGYNAQTGKVEEFTCRPRPQTSNADEWALWLQEHADYGIEFKAVQIAEALDSMHRGATNAALRPLREMSAKMAEDEGLWFRAETAAEAYVQQELRKLCAAIEAEGVDDAEEQVRSPVIRASEHLSASSGDGSGSHNSPIQRDGHE